jgi:hypothetical protein
MVSVVDIQVWLSQLIAHFKTMSNIWFDAELNGLQNKIIFFLAIDFWPRHLVKILKNEPNFICWKIDVFWLFRFWIEIQEKCHIYSFVEQVKLYRLVYDSIWIRKEFQEKNSKKVISQFFSLFEGIFEGVLGRSTLAGQQ